MKKHLALAFLVALGCAIPAWSQDAPQPPEAAASTAAKPWEAAAEVLKATIADVNENGIRAVGAHVDDLEQALAGADKAYEAAAAGTDKEVYVLTEGSTDSLMALVGAAAAHDRNPTADQRNVVAVDNPYPMISMCLGSYYNEVGRNEDALRALDRGLALNAAHGGELAASLPSLVSERAIALVQLKRLPEALEAYDSGLKLAAIDDRGKARMLRGRGYVLTEMSRLDEAEQAYLESLKLEPDNRIAKGELEYLKRLRAGGEKLPGGDLVIPDSQPKTKD